MREHVKGHASLYKPVSIIIGKETVDQETRALTYYSVIHASLTSESQRHDGK
jgi:hypothetical protein